MVATFLDGAPPVRCLVLSRWSDFARRWVVVECHLWPRGTPSMRAELKSRSIVGDRIFEVTGPRECIADVAAHDPGPKV